MDGTLRRATVIARAVLTWPLFLVVGVVVGPLLATVFWWGRTVDYWRDGQPRDWWRS